MKTNNWKKTLINENRSILDTINSLNQHGLQISIVIGKNKKIRGVVNDGDLRRAILNKTKLTDPIKKIMNKKPIVVSNTTDNKKILNLMNLFKITSIPIINSKKEVQGLARWNDVIKKKINSPLVIMSGGKGSRMLPLTKNKPKSLLKIKGKPILQHILEKAHEEGISEIFISINHLGSQIKKFINKSPFKQFLKINFLEEKKVLGTAGSLSLIKKKFRDPIVIINGDVITELKFRDLIQFHKDNRSDATMSVKMIFKEIQFGVIRNKKSKIVNIEEKPLDYSMVNAGVYALNKKVLGFLKKNSKIDMTELFSLMMKKNLNVTAFPIHEKWADIGNKESYKKVK